MFSPYRAKESEREPVTSTMLGTMRYSNTLLRDFRMTRASSATCYRNCFNRIVGFNPTKFFHTYRNLQKRDNRTFTGSFPLCVKSDKTATGFFFLFSSSASEVFAASCFFIHSFTGLLMTFSNTLDFWPDTHERYTQSSVLDLQINIYRREIKSSLKHWCSGEIKPHGVSKALSHFTAVHQSPAS